MNVAGINLRSDKTQILEATIKKEVVTVKQLSDMPSIFPTLRDLKKNETGDFFLSLREQLKNKNAEIYIGIPDELIKKVDCSSRDYVAPPQWDNVVFPWMKQLLQADKDDYVTTPLHFRRKNISIITGIAIQTSYIDLLFQAAVAAKLDLQLIEPSFFALLRYLNQWESEHCVMEVGERSTSIVSYNPISGMFKLGFSYGWTHFLPAGRQKFEQCIAVLDFTAYNTHGLINVNVPIYLISPKRRELAALLTESKFSGRIRSIPYGNFEEHICTDIAHATLISYAVPLGLAFAPLHERMVLYGRDTTR